ncbi:DUF4372 domain-containing protein [Methyloglobulus sp.]|uniref:DUF4372 domain-containing protein n=1 Tax=Methyloglobulus sp. TaxID=2518622 RepID=UPI0032B7F0DA
MGCHPFQLHEFFGKLRFYPLVNSHGFRLVAFAQLMDHLPLHTFRRSVERFPSNYPTKTFSHIDQFLYMAFAQLTYRDSLRDIEACLRVHQTKLYHLGIRGRFSRICQWVTRLMYLRLLNSVEQ